MMVIPVSSSTCTIRFEKTRAASYLRSAWLRQRNVQSCYPDLAPSLAASTNIADFYDASLRL